MTLNISAPAALDLLLSRRSGSAKRMTGPGPASEQLELILRAAARVPDHGKLTPWRFVVFEGEARARMGAALAEALSREDPSAATPERLDTERARFLRAPVVVAVVSSVRTGTPIPEWEQVLSAGAVCQTLLIAAHALGFVGNWITEWCAYSKAVAEKLGLGTHERIAGFVYLGWPAEPLEDRQRPDLAKIVTHF